MRMGGNLLWLIFEDSGSSFAGRLSGSQTGFFGVGPQLQKDAGSGALEQMVLAEFCNRQFDSHVKTIRTFS